jgi:hypothetical protein
MPSTRHTSRSVQFRACCSMQSNLISAPPQKWRQIFVDVQLHPGTIELVPHGRKLWRLIGWQWQSLALIKLTDGLPHEQLLSSCAAWRGSSYGDRDPNLQRLLSRSTTTFRVISAVSYRLSFVIKHLSAPVGAH